LTLYYGTDPILRASVIGLQTCGTEAKQKSFYIHGEFYDIRNQPRVLRLHLSGEIQDRGGQRSGMPVWRSMRLWRRLRLYLYSRLFDGMRLRWLTRAAPRVVLQPGEPDIS
jgi:hypothetical protein